MKDTETLDALKAELMKYSTLNCKLKHESILSASINNCVDIPENDLEPIINRFGFCNQNIRSTTISCAHTTAGFKFKNLLISIANHINSFQGDKYANKVDKLLGDIYMLDNERGSLEKEFAINKLNNKECPDIKSARTAIAQLACHHSKLVAELELVRQTIIADLNQYNS